jgi:G3E family GTPase
VGADMSALVMAFYNTELEDITCLDSIIAMLNCADLSLDSLNKVQEYVDDIYRVREYADIIIFNDADLLDEVAVDRLGYHIRYYEDKARILRSRKIQVPLPLISSLGWSNIYNISNANEFLGSMSSFSFESNQAFSIRKFQHFVDNRLSRNVFQVIGTLWFDESPKKHQFRLSGKRFSSYDDEWDEDKQSNSLIFIGLNLDSETLNSQLLACLSS